MNDFSKKIIAKSKKIIPKILGSIIFTIIFYVFIIAPLIFTSFPEETAQDILKDNNALEQLMIIFILLLIIIMILLLSIDLHTLPKNIPSLLKVTVAIMIFTGSIVWLDLQVISPEEKILDLLTKAGIVNPSETVKPSEIQIPEIIYKFLSKFIELIAVASAVNFLISYRSEQSKFPKDNVPNQNIDTKQAADSEKSESKNEQANHPTENNQTDTSKPEQSSEEKESPHD